MMERKTEKKGCSEIVIPWKGKAEENFVYFLKDFHVIKFKVLNLSPILLIVCLERSVLTANFTAFALYSLLGAGCGPQEKNIYTAVHPFK